MEEHDERQLAVTNHAPSEPIESDETSPQPRPAGRLHTLRTHGVAFLLGAAAALATVWFWPTAQPPDRGEVLPWVTPSGLRGDLPPFSRLRLDSGMQAIALSLTLPARLDPSRSAQILVHAPDGRTILREQLDARDLQRGMALLVLRSAGVLSPGLYELKCEQDGLPDAIVLRFELLSGVERDA